MIGKPDDETNFPHKLLLTNRQVANLRKAFTNHTSTDIKLSKAQLTKMQKGGFLRFLAPLSKSGLPLLKIVIKPLGVLGLTAAASAADAAINKKIKNKKKIKKPKKSVTYFDSFGVEHLPKEIKKFINNKNIIANFSRIKAYDSVMCEYFCIGFISYMFMGKSLTNCAKLFSPNNFNKNDDIILNYFLTNL